MRFARGHGFLHPPAHRGRELKSLSDPSCGKTTFALWVNDPELVFFLPTLSENCPEALALVCSAALGAEAEEKQGNR